MRNRIGVLVYVLMVVALGLALAGPTAAEGARYSSVDGVFSGFNYRNYDDNNSDGVYSETELGNCRAYNAAPDAFSYATIDLWRVYSWAPDDNYGGGNAYCYNYYAVGLGDEPAGTYHWTIMDIRISNGERSGMSAPYVNYYW